MKKIKPNKPAATKINLDEGLEINKIDGEEFESNYSDDEFSTSDEDNAFDFEEIAIDDDPSFNEIKKRSRPKKKQKQRHCFNLENTISIRRTLFLLS